MLAGEIKRRPRLTHLRPSLSLLAVIPIVVMNAGNIAAEILKGKDPKTIAPSRPAYKDHMSRKALAL